MGTPLKTLILGETATDMPALRLHLQQGGFDPDCDLVSRLDALPAAFDGSPWDVILCQQCLDWVPTVLEGLRQRELDLPVIVIAGVIPMAEAVTLLRAGIHDFVYSDDLASLGPAVERALREAEQRRRTRRAMQQREQRYRTIFDTVPVSIWEGDLSVLKAAIDELKERGITDFRRYLTDNPAFIQWAAGMVKVLDVNKTTLDLYGAPSREELQAALDRVLVSQTLHIFHDLLVAIAEGKTYFKGETVCRTLKGQLINVIVSLAIPTETSAFKNTLVSVADITAHKHIEEELAKSQQNFQNVVMKNQAGILLTDAEGTVLFSNPAAQILLGRRAEELEGQQLGLPIVTEPTAEIDIIRPGQGVGVAEMSVTQTEWQGRPGWLAMLNDVTERKLAEAERRKVEREIQRHKTILEEIVRERTAELLIAKDAAEAANRAKTAFLANMSHELRTPLHGILSFTRLGIKKNDVAPPEKRLHYFQKINESAETLLTLLNDLLDLAKLESGKAAFEFGSTDLCVLVYKVIDEFNPLASERQITINFDRPPGRSQVVVDKLKMMQVLRNLLSNALKFSPDGGTIRIGLRPEDGDWLFSLRDQGMGIPEEELETVFDKFIQSSKTKTGAGGTGLGLAISQEIIVAHRGRIWAENNPDGGAQFCFRIPAQQARGSDNLVLNAAEANTRLVT